MPDPSDIDADETPETTAHRLSSPTTTTLDPVLSGLMAKLESGQPHQKMHMKHRTSQVIGVTVQELRSAAARYPSNPKAQEFLQATMGMKADQEVFVDQPDIQALVQNARVVVDESHVETDDGPVVLQTKRVVS